MTRLADTPLDYKMTVLCELGLAMLRYPFLKLTLGKIGNGSLVYSGVRLYGRRNIYIDTDVSILSGAELTAYKKGAHISIGPHSVIHRFCELNAFDGFIRIGRNCTLHQGSVIYGNGGVTIGEHVRIATGAVVAASRHNFDRTNIPIAEQGMKASGIVIGNDVWLGAGVIITDGVTVADGCVVGAGAVVTRDLPGYSVAMGVPARIVGKRGDMVGVANET